jgi:steroid 5-alpha reductase family enzyme
VLAGRIRNFGLLDVLWTYGFLVAVGFATGLGDGWGPRRLLLAAVVGLWSLRLGTHVLIRVVRAHPAEDPRYAQWRSAWGAGFAGRMTGFFQLQAASVVLLATPFYVAAHNPMPALRPLELAGAALALAGIVGEATADWQLAAFKAARPPATAVCQRGLWRYSRHPNYFFEFITWLGIAAFAWDSRGGAWALISPALILYFLLGVTGIPMTERQSVASKGDSFRRYQRTTSAFVPWAVRRPESG